MFPGSKTLCGYKKISSAVANVRHTIKECMLLSKSSNSFFHVALNENLLIVKGREETIATSEKKLSHVWYRWEDNGNK